MASTVSIKVPALSALQEKLSSPESLRKSAADGVARCVRIHLRKRNSTRPTITVSDGDMPHSGYYSKAANTVIAELDGSAVTITSPGLSMHIHGGTILPKKQHLAIPISTEVAGIWPSEYIQRHGKKSVFKIKSKKGSELLVRKLDKKSIKPLWFLSKSTTLKPDPSVIPTQEQLSKAAHDAVKDAIDAAAITGSTPP